MEIFPEESLQGGGASRIQKVSSAYSNILEMKARTSDNIGTYYYNTAYYSHKK